MNYGFNWPLLIFDVVSEAQNIVLGDCNFLFDSFKFMRWGIADLGPLLDVMQQRPDLVIEMTPQFLHGADEAGSAECSARGSEWRRHEAAWRHSFAKKWRFEGHQFTKHHAPSLYTINRPEKFGFRFPGHIIFLGSVTMLHVSFCFISCFTSLCMPRRSKFRHCWNGKLGLPLVFRRHCKFRELICSPLSFAVQFCTNSFSNSSFYRHTTWGSFKIRDTQMVNRSSQPLDLGARKFWDTPGKLWFYYKSIILRSILEWFVCQVRINQPTSQPAMKHSSKRSNWSFGPSSRWCMPTSSPQGGPRIQLQMGL